MDLFFAGKETTASSLVWLIYYLATYTEAQHKMQAEVDEVLPKGTLATLQDRARLPYTEAVIHETLRVSSLSANGGSHAASKDTMLGGYVISKCKAMVGGKDLKTDEIAIITCLYKVGKCNNEISAISGMKLRTVQT
ncbi:hypothetical protein Pmani_031131 [Petrolisthes manimaculis]|uniref:Cytochrome P450 n=1 Tax=Petrolisthes manimaculis TaxID=1843537 RepID=A0AAE1NVX9_9EUCA|nr:hypothetical protein Pmani_031131 [Petrolisthes manimaculis]